MAHGFLCGVAGDALKRPVQCDDLAVGVGDDNAFARVLEHLRRQLQLLGGLLTVADVKRHADHAGAALLVRHWGVVGFQPQALAKAAQGAEALALARALNLKREIRQAGQAILHPRAHHRGEVGRQAAQAGAYAQGKAVVAVHCPQNHWQLAQHLIQIGFAQVQLAGEVVPGGLVTQGGPHRVTTMKIQPVRADFHWQLRAVAAQQSCLPAMLATGVAGQYRMHLIAQHGQIVSVQQGG